VNEVLRLTPAFPGAWPRRARRIVERNALAYRRGWLIILSGFFEPLFYLLSIGVGIGKLVGRVAGPGGQLISYREYIAPALLATSAFNGAVFDSTHNIFDKLRWTRIYDVVVATPLQVRDVALGEAVWAMVRGLLYSAMFVVVMLAMGLVSSWWAVLLLPACALIGFAFAACGLAATSFTRTFEDMEIIGAAQMIMFLFSATFAPLASFPSWSRPLVRCSPLYHAMVLTRGLTLGGVGWFDLVRVTYLAALAVVFVTVAGRRLHRLLVP
jgi:lipooligosaccharide transport system permease protein